MKLVIPLILIYLFVIPSFNPIEAANCDFKYYNPSDLNTPITPNQNMGDLSVTIKSNELKSGTYRVQLIRANGSQANIRNINFTSGTATFTTNKPSATEWLAGDYKLYFIEQDKTGNPQDIAGCQTRFTITDIPVSSACIASIENKPIDPDTGVVLVVNGITSGTYDIFVKGRNTDKSFSNSITTGDRLVLGTFNVGRYTVTIKKDSRLQCNIVSFDVAPTGSGGGGQVGTSDTGTVPAATPCTGANCSSGGGESCDVGGTRGPAFKTAIGCIHTNPAEFVKDFMTFIVAISGGFAFLLMLLGAFQMLTSAGNPDSLNAGRERLTNAIIGLLFVIFATLLMQVIGISILNIPGFK